MSAADTPLKVVVAEDSVLLREGLCRLLEDSGFEVAGQAGDAEDLMRKVGAHKPDVAVIDVRMPPSHTDEGLVAARRIRAEHPGTGVLVLSQYVEEAYALDLLSEDEGDTVTAMAMLAQSIGDPDARAVAGELIESVVIGPIADWLGEPHAPGRAQLVALLGLGFAALRKLVPPDPGGEEARYVARWMANALQRLADGED